MVFRLMKRTTNRQLISFSQLRLSYIKKCDPRILTVYNLSQQHQLQISSQNSERSSGSSFLKKCSVAFLGMSAAIGWHLYNNTDSPVECKSQPSFREFSREEVSKRNNKSSGIWVIYKNQVYDITEFVDNHPGGSEKVMLAAGGDLEPYWDMYAFHKKDEVLEMLKEYRIGTLQKKDWTVAKKTQGPFAKDPKRHPALMANSTEPYNAETPSVLAAETWITPNELFFVRNHLPVPDLNEKDSKLVIDFAGRRMYLNLADLKSKFPKVSIVAAIQCAGNRRSEMNKVKKVKGLSWSHNAISNAKWSGVLLKDLLLAAGVDPNDPTMKHIHFEGADRDLTGVPYGASIPANRIFDKNLPVLIAYEMNDRPLPRDHGFPLRIIAPGIVGARNVKWLQRVAVSDEEYNGHWQQNDYKPFSPNVDWDNVDFSKSTAIQELPVTSAICFPTDGTTIDESEEEITVKGYAYSGGGRAILRVDLSCDGGKTWITSDLTHQEKSKDLVSTYSWTLWQCQVPIPKGHNGRMNILCKAVDSSCNTQPDTVSPVWNLRGCLNNSWHRIDLSITNTV